MQVLPNSFHGVRGNYQVNVLWLLNGQSTQWEAALPKATQQWLVAKRDATSGPLKGYPNAYNVLQAPVELVTLLSQQASWAVRAKQSLVQDWVAASQQCCRAGWQIVNVEGAAAANFGRMVPPSKQHGEAHNLDRQLFSTPSRCIAVEAQTGAVLSFSPLRWGVGPLTWMMCLEVVTLTFIFDDVACSTEGWRWDEISSGPQLLTASSPAQQLPQMIFTCTALH